MRFNLLVISLTACCLAVAFGCDRDDSIRVYQAPKDSQASASPREMPAPATAPAASEPGQIVIDGARMSIPAGWEKQPDKAMRVATFRAGPAEVIISRFGAESFAQLLPNVNRWRGQVGLEPLNDEREITEEPAISGMKVFDFTGPKQRARVAVAKQGPSVWFFKIQGPKDSVAGQQKTFDEFLGSIRFE